VPDRRSLALSFLALLAAAAPSVAQTFVFHLGGDQEVPPVPSTASGGCLGVLDQVAGQLDLTCVHGVAGATVMHIHRGAAGVNGPVAFDLGNPASPVVATWTGMTLADVAELQAGGLYVNIHTSGRPEGEIRGQMLARTVDTVAFTADGAQVVPPSGTAATGSCTADLDDAATGLSVGCTHDLPSPEAAHVHSAPFGENGPIEHTFASAASPLADNVPMTPLLVASFAAGHLYLEVHGPTGTEDGPPSGTIRGQIGDPPAAATTGTIRVAKRTTPAGGAGFSFTDDVPGSPGAFTLDDGDVETFSGVPPGNYTISEVDPAAAPGGYTLADLDCADADSGEDLAAGAATVVLQAGETVTCSFHNLAVPPAGTLFVFHLSGDQEAPPVPSAARGGCFASFDAGASSLTLLCTHDVAGATVMHIHRGAPGVNGPVAFDLGVPLSPVTAVWTGMAPADVADLLAGNLYVNIHTAGRPAGEIRGQVLPRTVDSFAFPASGVQEVPANGSTARGRCFADLADDAEGLLVGCDHDVADPTSIHLHQAPAGQEGPVVFDFPVGDPFAATVPMTPRLVADFAAGFLYVNVHSVEAPEGEIRGQLLPGQLAATEIPTLGEWALLALALALAGLGARRLGG
jgi:hypothetical protein